MDNIILYLLTIIQYQYQQICWLLNFICRYIPLKQWAHEGSHSPKYQKYKVDELPLIGYPKHDWDRKDLLVCYKKHYHKEVTPIQRRSECDIPESTVCPHCGAPVIYLYKNNGDQGQILCKICDTKFSPEENRHTKTMTLRCPYCGHSLVAKKNRKFFHEFGESFRFNITRVIGLTNGNEVSKEFRPFKQIIERLNRTYKASYRPTNGFDSIDGANYDLALRGAYYNFLRTHKHNKYRPLNEVEMPGGADNMPGKWQLLIYLGQRTISELQKQSAA